MSPDKHPTPPLGVPLSSHASHDSDELEALPSPLAELEAAALADLPQGTRLVLGDVYRRLRGGARKMSRLDLRADELDRHLGELQDHVMPRATPERLGKALGWGAKALFGVIAAALVVIGWIAALDRFAKADDLEKLEIRVRANERAIDKLPPPRSP